MQSANFKNDIIEIDIKEYEKKTPGFGVTKRKLTADWCCEVKYKTCFFVLFKGKKPAPCQN